MEVGKWAAVGGSRTERDCHPLREAQNATGVDKYEARSNEGGQMGGSGRIEAVRAEGEGEEGGHVLEPKAE